MSLRVWVLAGTCLSLVGCQAHVAAPAAPAPPKEAPPAYALHGRSVHLHSLVAFVSRTKGRTVIVGGEVPNSVDLDVNLERGSLQAIEDGVVEGSASPSVVIGKTAIIGGRERIAAAKGNPLVPALGHSRGQYRGRLVTLKFTRCRLTLLISLLGDVSKRRFEVAEGVESTVTIAANAVPWDEILDALLVANDLGQEEVDGVIRISRVRERAQRFAPPVHELPELPGVTPETRALELRSKCASPLAGFDVGELRLVAVLSGLPESEAFVEWPGAEGEGWIVRKGDCIGTAGGLVTRVERDRVVVREPAVDDSEAGFERVLELGAE